jgi:hypothetical protein
MVLVFLLGGVCAFIGLSVWAHNNSLAFAKLSVNEETLNESFNNTG